MSDPPLELPRRKKPKTATGAGSSSASLRNNDDERNDNEIDVRLRSANPSLSASSSDVLEIVAENGWFPWHVDDESGQNPDYSNLRLVSRGSKAAMDAPKCGGPNFGDIVRFLDSRNGFNDIDESGFCDHCWSHKGEGCETCGEWYDECPCKESHRYGPVLVELDPRLNPEVKFDSLPDREKAKLLLLLLRRVASNFHDKYYKEWRALLTEAWTEDPELDESEDEGSPDLTMFDHSMRLHNTFLKDFEKYNRPIFNFIHHLLFTGWAENDCYTCPGWISPYRGRLLGDGEDYNSWNGGHEERFGGMFQCFIRLHKSDEEETVPPPSMRDGFSSYVYTLSQIQYLPETIRRCVANAIDREARSLLGRSIADSIDIYRLVRETYDYDDNAEILGKIRWMPCLGVPKEDFVPLDSFEGYNPKNEYDNETGHERYNINGTGLLWGDQE
ncbi:hypothetical protein ACHAWF_010324 [Thalassiosira exigua]